MARTKQQQAVIDAVINNDGLVKTSAVAGSGKTFTLVELANELKPKSGLYLAYNKAIAEEATAKFKGTNIKCSTIHSLAYGAVVRQYGLNVGYFNVRNVVPSNISYRAKTQLIETIEEFCVSAFTDPVEYLASINASERLTELFWHHLNGMSDGSIACTHSFYLKLFHIFLSDGTIELPEVELLLVDEAGDLTALTVEIFKLIKAPKKVAVGDPMQNIYSFNNTINAFNVLADEGIEANLTESFRVAEHIAEDIQEFVRTHLDPKFEFKGHKYTSAPKNHTKGYIARTNSGLLEEMFRLMESNIPFSTARKIDNILELPLILANLGNGKPVTNKAYKHLEALRLKYERTPSISNHYDSVTAYVRENSERDDEITNAIRVVAKHGPTDLNRLIKYVKECSKVVQPIMLSTAHSSKGLEFTEVEIAPDLNQKVSKTLLEIDKENSRTKPNAHKLNILNEELRLYYVACSRAMMHLHNATELKELKWN